MGKGCEECGRDGRLTARPNKLHNRQSDVATPGAHDDTRYRMERGFTPLAAKLATHRNDALALRDL
jgi:hypothetical protein